MKLELILKTLLGILLAAIISVAIFGVTGCTPQQRETLIDLVDLIPDKPEVPPTPPPMPPEPPEPEPPKEPEFCKKYVTYRNGFLWKPRSESNVRLVVLLPSSTRGKWEAVSILRADDSVAEVGRFDGDQHNGNRPHFRFTKTGASYGDNLRLRVLWKDGKTTDYKIPQGCARVE